MVSIRDLYFKMIDLLDAIEEHLEENVEHLLWKDYSSETPRMTPMQFHSKYPFVSEATIYRYISDYSDEIKLTNKKNRFAFCETSMINALKRKAAWRNRFSLYESLSEEKKK